MDDITLLVAVGLIVLYFALRVFNLCSRSTAPIIVSGGSEQIRHIIDGCPILHQIYKPPPLFGKQGHFQTLLYGILGRFRTPSPRAHRRVYTRMSDGATSTFDLFKPLQRHSSGAQITVCICPGIGNSSEADYIRTTVNLLQKNGYRCAVLNHLGVLPNVRLTAPRIFSYGGTEEFGAMITWLRENHPSNHLLGVGLSMGANVMTKFLGESVKNQKNFIGALSICQGYDMEKGAQLMSEWKWTTGMIGYVWSMSQLIRSIMSQHKEMLFGKAAEKKYGVIFDVKKIFSPWTLLNEIDDEYTKKVHGFKDLSEYYRSMSSSRVMDQIEIPVCFFNALDDPIVPVELQEIPKEVVKKSKNAMHVTTKFGGHLGFYEGSIFPRSLTWMDRLIVEFCSSVVKSTENRNQAGSSKSAPVEKTRYNTSIPNSVKSI